MRFSTILAASLATLILFAPVAAVAQEAEAEAEAEADALWLDIELGKSIVLELPENASAIAITDPDVANVQPLGVAQKIQVQGTALGSTDLVIQFGSTQEPQIYEITVSRDLSDLVRRIDSIVDGPAPRVYPLDERIVVQGEVDDLDTLEQITLVSRIYDPEFVNLMTVRGDHQVQLEVVFAELSRSALRSLGLNVLWGTDNVMAGVYTATPGAMTSAVTHTSLQASQGQLSQILPGMPGGFNAFTYIGQLNLGAVLASLDRYVVSRTLSRPQLVSLSGQKAEFLAGGELPVPSPGQAGMIMVNFKPYGIIMSFVPTVLANNIIDIRVQIEVSEVDDATGTSVTGVSIPGFKTRKANSHLRVESGKTFAMAGMLREQSNFERVGIPGLSKIPLLGAAFRTVVHRRDETELMIFVTPKLVRPLAPGEVPSPPGTTENFNPGDLELFLLGRATKAGSRTAEPTAKSGLKR